MLSDTKWQSLPRRAFLAPPVQYRVCPDPVQNRVKLYFSLSCLRCSTYNCPTRVIAFYVEHVRLLLNPQNDYLLLTRNGTQCKKLGNAMCQLLYQAIGKYIHPARYRQIIEMERAKTLSLKDQKNISLDQKHSFQVARVYYQNNTSRRIAVDGQIFMKRLLGGSRDTSHSLIKSMLFSEMSESDIFKADLKEIKSTHRIDEEQDDPESFIPCAQARNKSKRNLVMTIIQPHQIL